MVYQKNTAERKYCPKCDRFFARTEFYKNKASSDGLAGLCKTCDKKANAARKKAKPGYYHDMNVMYKRLRIFNITPEKFQDMMKDQNYSCLLCNTHFDNVQFNIDHDHACCDGRYSCGECVRGILCGPCNRGLGHFKDNIETMKKAVEYLQNNTGQ